MFHPLKSLRRRGTGRSPFPVTPADRRVAKQVYDLFAAKPHSEHIASEFALAHMAAILRTRRIGSALEFGAGIGTITYLLLRSLPADATVECTEANALCLNALRDNIPPDLYRRLIVHDQRDAAFDRPFDLIIIDGRIADEPLYLGLGSICFAEGRRSKARRALEQAARAQGYGFRFTRHYSGTMVKWFPQPGRWFPVFKLKPKKGCWIGEVVAASQREKAPRPGHEPAAPQSPMA